MGTKNEKEITLVSLFPVPAQKTTDLQFVKK